MIIWAIALVAAFGAWVGWANPVYQEPFFALLFPAGLAWLAITAASPRQALKRGFLTALLAYSGCLYWVFVPVHRYGNIPMVLALPCPVLLAMYLAVYPAVFCGMLRWARSKLSPLALGLFAGLLWGSLELAVGVVFTGFPWLPLAAAMAARPFAIQAAALIGGTGLATLLVTATTWFVLPGRRLPITLPRILAILLVAGWAVIGMARLDDPLPQGRWARVGIVQGNIDQSLKWDPGYQTDTVSRYIDLSEKLVRQNPVDLLVWPETALPFFLQELTHEGARVRNLARTQEILLLTGSPAYEFDLANNRYIMYNRTFLLGPQGGTMGQYDKMHLVPFGEYVPLGGILPLTKLVQAVGDFREGTDGQPLAGGNLALGVLICYETIFPALAQERVTKGASVLVNMSNDAWFGQTSAPRQHLQLAALRAVEQGRYMIRSTNTGISAIIDPRGRIVQETELFKTASLSGNISAIYETTVYHDLAWLLQSVIIGLTLLLVVWAILRARQAQTPTVTRNT
ncbi:MAG: apolipoprotein N-acyltransferase [Desulfocurvibacter africanus]